MVKKSMLHRQHENQNADFTELKNNCIVVGQYGDLEQEKRQFSNISITDLTTLNRIGFKGKDTPRWLEKQNINLPEKPNTAICLKDGTLVAKLSNNEYLFLSNTKNESDICEQLSSWEIEKGNLCYRLNRDHSHSYFLLSGEHSITVMSKICGVDLRDENFPVHSVAQTSVARTNSIVIKDTIAGTTVFHLLFDSASSEFMWTCILDAMLEFSGQPIGVNAINA